MLHLKLVIGEDRKITVALPNSIPPGPVEVVIVATPGQATGLSWKDAHGLGEEIWEGIDAQDYVNKLRRGDEL